MMLNVARSGPCISYITQIFPRKRRALPDEYTERRRRRRYSRLRR